MKSNVFKDFPFVKTNKGPMTVEEFFHSSHEESLHLDLSIPGYEYGAIWRLLASLTAVIVQRDPSLLEEVESGSELSLDPEFISQILDDLGSKISLTEGKNLFSNALFWRGKTRRIPLGMWDRGKILLGNYRQLPPVKNPRFIGT